MITGEGSSVTHRVACRGMRAAGGSGGGAARAHAAAGGRGGHGCGVG
eukprot:COSAG01_NODE_52460_length_346_cov_1.376518_2_plen_46_part_01